jgi:stage II sporulation protein E
MKENNLKRVLIQMIGILMARVAFSGVNPIAVGYFAAIYIERSGRIGAMLAIILGMATVLPAITVIKYVLVLVILSIIVSLIEYSGKYVSVWLMGLLASVITTAMTIAGSLLENNAQYNIMLGIAEGIGVFALTFIFRKGIEPLLHEIKGQVLDNEQIISLAVILGIAIYGLPKIEITGFSLITTASLFFVLFLGYKYGAGYGALAGAACGIILAIDSSQMNQIGYMCMVGIIAGTFRELGRFITTTMYASGVLLLGDLYQNSQFDLSLVGALASSAVLFLLLPKNLMIKVSAHREGENEDIFVRQNIQNIAKGKLRDFSESFQNLSDTFNSIAEKKTALDKYDKNKVFDEISEHLCKDCTNCNLCWKSNFYETYQGAYRIIEVVEKNGTIALHEVPSEFAGRCIYLDHFLSETRRILELAKLNLTWHNRMAESREAIAGQLSEVANIIDDFSLDLYKTAETTEEMKKRLIYQLKSNHIMVKRVAVFDKRNEKQEIYMTARTEKGLCITTKEAASLVSSAFGKRMRPGDGCKNVMTKDYDTFVFVEDTEYKVITGMAKMTKEGARISGDNFSFIYPDSSTVIMTLSDGMGSGEAACEESESVVELLEQFMEAGFKKESAIKLINSILVLKSEEQTFSTIDMSIINLFTGSCDIIKIGASSTFIKREGWVETIQSQTLPAGIINQMDYDVLNTKLKDGDFIIMVTDGVVDCIPGEEKEKFLEEFISDLTMNNPGEIANAVLNQALELNHWVPKDDMTVLTIGFWKKLK